MNSLNAQRRNRDVETAMNLQVHAREYARLREFGGEVATLHARRLRLVMMRDVLRLATAAETPRAA